MAPPRGTAVRAVAAAAAASQSRPTLLLEQMVEPPAERCWSKKLETIPPQHLRSVLGEEAALKRSSEGNTKGGSAEAAGIDPQVPESEVAADATALRKDFHPYHSQAVPKPENLQANAPTTQSAKPTAMMLRNIPNKYSQNSLMQEINDCGFRGTYNFFYLPMDVHNRSNVGYAFINFEVAEDAERFRQKFAEHRFARYHSHKIGTVSVAHMQGLHSNLRHFENRAVTQARNDQYRPVVLKGDKRLDFDAALEEAQLQETTAQVHQAQTCKVINSPPPGLDVPCAAEQEFAASGGEASCARKTLEAAIEELLASEEAEMTRKVSNYTTSTMTPASSRSPHSAVVDMSNMSDGSEGYSSGAGEASSDVSATEGVDADVAHLQLLKQMLGASLSDKGHRQPKFQVVQTMTSNLFRYPHSGRRGHS
mmetsp:Transcript_29530/g.68100  ORF Transcript_29530/g.68100 Transcript_29530/m.68100 type:complete len:423 (+) Transcript_29530:113-1381(+)